MRVKVEHLERTLQEREQLLGPDHLELVEILDNLAGAHRELDELDRAEHLEARALVIRGRPVASGNDFKVVLRLQDFWFACKKLGKHEEAQQAQVRLEEIAQNYDMLWHLHVMRGYTTEPFHDRARQIREKLGLKNRPMALEREPYPAAELLDCLAEPLRDAWSDYKRLGQHDEAGRVQAELEEIACKLDMLEPFSRRAQRIREQLRDQSYLKDRLPALERELGPEHPEVAECLDYLAEQLLRDGRYAEAEPLFQRALKIREKVLGPDHLDVANSLSNLSRLYLRQGRDGEGVPLMRRAMAIRQKKASRAP
jgi:tetratricopeptide (TPR) repeat protein